MESNITNIKLNFTDVVSKVNSVENKAPKNIEKENSENVISVEKPNNNEQLLNAIEVVSTFIEPQIRNVNFLKDESSGKTVIKVFDTQSQELIKQFPSEEVLKLAEKIRGLQVEVANKTGILIDDKI